MSDDTKGEPREARRRCHAISSSQDPNFNNHSDAGRAVVPTCRRLQPSDSISKKEASRPIRSNVGHSSLKPNGSYQDLGDLAAERGCVSRNRRCSHTDLPRRCRRCSGYTTVGQSRLEAQRYLRCSKTAYWNIRLAGNPIVVAGMTTSEIADAVAAANQDFREPQGHSGCPRLCESRRYSQRLCRRAGKENSAS